MNYNRGDVWLVDLGSVAKVRPCLVLSIPALDRDRALTTLIPLIQILFANYSV
jgi:mRNA interferase MazF